MSELVDLLKRHEGIRLYVYDDATGQPIQPGSFIQGHPTIGIGRALDVNGISQDEAEYLLSNDIQYFVGALRRAYPWYGRLLAARQDSLASMAFNLGMAGFATFHDMIAALEASDYQAAAAAMLASKWATQVGKRAEELAQMVATGAYQ